MSESLGEITEVCVGFSSDWTTVKKLDPPLDATPEVLERLDANPFVGAYHIKFKRSAKPCLSSECDH